MRHAAALALLVVLATGAGAGQTADGVVVAGERLRTGLQGGEEKIVGVAALAGTRLTLQVKRMKRSGVVPSLRVSAPDGAAFDLTGRLKGGKRSARVKKLPIEQTGVWQVTVISEIGGGDVELTTRSNPPKAYTFKDILPGDAGAFDEHVFEALPGATLTLSLKSTGKPKWTPQAEVIAPSGTIVAPTAAKKKSKAPTYRLPELGVYTLRVTGDGGKYRARLKLKPMSAKTRTLGYRDVELRAHIQDFDPRTAPNDSLLGVQFTGSGFRTSQTVALSDGDGHTAAATFSGITAQSAFASLDLTGLPPGDYEFRFITRIGNESPPAGTFTITNHPPSAGATDPPELPWAPVRSIQLEGAGFDANVTLSAHRTEDGLPIPVTIDRRIDHAELDVTLRPPPYAVGPIDFVLTDPAGSSTTFAEGFSLVGYSAAPVDLERFTGTGVGTHFPRSAAYNAQDETVLLGVQTGDNVTFVLFDPATREVLDSIEWVGSPTTPLRAPFVEWSPVDNTWAMAYVTDRTGQDQGIVRIARADDLRDELFAWSLGEAQLITRVHVAADRVNGGFVAVWDVSAQGFTSLLLTAQILSNGAIGAFQEVYENEFGAIWDPVIEFLRDDRFVIVHASASDNGFFYAVRRVIVRGDGRLAQATRVLATATDWRYVGQPEIVENPEEQSVLLTFNYVDDLVRPAYLRLEGNSALPDGDLEILDSAGQFPQGLVDSVVWNADRSEFVVALTNENLHVVVRRVAPDGRIKPAWELQAEEGVWGILYAGPQKGSLGMVRAFDGRADGRHEDLGQIWLRAGPMK